MNSANTLSPDDQKAVLRGEARARRKVAVAAAGTDVNEQFTRNMFALAEEVHVDGYSVIAGYWAMADELDVMPAMIQLGESRGARGCLPVVVKNNAPLIFRQWQPGTVMESGGFGTHHPSSEMAELIPTIIMVPLLGFDASGYRLGWGGGFYDRTLAMLRDGGHHVVAVGTAYAGQEIDAVVRDQYDQPVDWIVTEREVRRAVMNTEQA